MNLNGVYFFCILLVGFTISCANDDIIINEENQLENEIISYEPISNCGNYESHKQQNFSNINFATEFNGDYIYGGLDRLQIWDDFGLNLLHEIDDQFLGATKVVDIDNYALICTNKGIYKFDEEKELKPLTSVSCADIVIFKDKILFSSPLGLLTPNDRRTTNIHLLNTDDGTYEFFTDPLDENNYSGLNDLQVIGDKIYAISSTNNDIRISEFIGSDFVRDYYQSQNIGLEKITYPGDPANSFLFAGEENLYFWTKNGPIRYLFLKKGNNFQEVIIEEHEIPYIEANIDKEFAHSNLTEIQILENKLLLGSNKGLFEIDLTSPELQMRLLVDSLIMNRNISSFVIRGDLNESSYIVTNYNTVVKISCN